ncbi:hypothetical protein V5N11_020899 [Cardamine amara subsp. amara]|uniref:Reverse transcriptase zinc-binding domain-containing protein n=1 Tax=Cardamine amara subsp. amara TaxID=228776 RepID=A0ABD0Z8A4_CARAN
MLSLRHLAKPLLGCVLGDGTKISFWFDNWCSLRVVWDCIGSSGPGTMGIPIDATVAEACGPNGWHLPPTRTRNQNLAALREVLLSMDPPSDSLGPDEYCTWGLDGSKNSFFTTSTTWNYHRPSEDKKDWPPAVWGKHFVPKHSLTFWTATLDRLPVRARLALWKTGIPMTCCLYYSQAETRDHLLLHCPFSEQVWCIVLHRVASYPCIFADCSTLITWLLSRIPLVSSTLTKIAAQAIIYLLWRERNNRLHNSVTSSSATVFAQIDRSGRDTLLSHRYRKGCGRLLSQWFARS